MSSYRFGCWDAGMLVNGLLYELGLYTLGLCTCILMLWLHT